MRIFLIFFLSIPHKQPLINFLYYTLISSCQPPLAVENALTRYAWLGLHSFLLGVRHSRSEIRAEPCSHELCLMSKSRAQPLACRQYMVLDARRSRLALRPPHYVPDFPLDLHCELHSLVAQGYEHAPWRTADAVLATAHQSWSDWDVAACRCAAESVPPTALGSLLTAFAQAHTARSATSGIGLPCRADTRCYSRHKPNARQVIGQRLWLTGTHSSASRHLHSPSSLQDKSCTASKPPCGQLLAEAAAATIWFYVTRKIPFALVKRKGHSHHTADNLRHVSLSLRTNNHAQAHYLPVRAERCSSLRSSRV